MKLTILGAGESGVGAAMLAQQLGYDVMVSDFGKIAERYKEELEKQSLPYEEGEHTWQRISEADEVIKSPGIPDTAPVVQRFLAQGTPVISEIEFAARHTNAPVIAITGSNGKTTSTYLTHHLLQTAGKRVAMGGNVGRSFARQVIGTSVDIWVLELSSFQLEGIVDFCPQVAVVLNITPDHLDRYEYDFERYAAAKMRIGNNQTGSDWLLLNETLRDRPELDRLRGQRVFVSNHFPNPDKIVVDRYEFDLRASAIRGAHNRFNAACAARAALLVGASPEAIQRGLSSFVPVPHRLEPVGELHGVRYLNDSKATNVDAVFYALQAVPGPIVWIAGGTDKGNDYTELMPLVKERVVALVCLGVDNEKLKTTFNGSVEQIIETGSAEEAVRTARQLAEPGATVLLSPACASFDLFKNYEDRGDQFRVAVQQLIAEEEEPKQKEQTRD